MTAEALAIANWAAEMRSPLVRTIGEFAEQEIWVPTGPRAGRRYRLDLSPAARLLFAELDSGRWQSAFITGPNQDGKSLSGFVIPTLYLLFERKETVVLGVPSLDLVTDKWRRDLKPVIEASRYKSEMPTSGDGARDGNSVLFEFKNGAFLRFMTAGGDDKSRSGFTASNLVVTETDGFDEVGGKSREGSKFDQLVHRTLAFGNLARIIAECTVSTETGRTWQEYKRGSASRIAIPCPDCREFVTPERKHLVGWQDAKTDAEAAANAAICCPECGVIWTNQQRIEANHQAILLHGEQRVVKGKIIGDVPKTTTLGFRWTVVNSILEETRLGVAAAKEWHARRAADEEAAEIALLQSQWALPAPGKRVDLSQLDAFAIMRRTIGLGRGIAPEKTQYITVGCDVGQRLCHWTAIAWREGATPHVLDYDRIEVPSDLMAPEEAILTALRDWRDDVVSRGWKRQGSDAIILPAFVLVDMGWLQETILAFIAESQTRGGYFATKGFGTGQRIEGQHRRETGSKVVASGENYHLIQLGDGRQYVEVGVDPWKSFLHARIQTPPDEAGAFTLFDAPDGQHLSFAKHLTAESQIEEFVPGIGTVKKWHANHRNNHWGDGTVLACVGGHAAGMRLTAPPPPPAPPPPLPPREPTERPDWMPDRPSNWMER